MSFGQKPGGVYQNYVIKEFVLTGMCPKEECELLRRRLFRRIRQEFEGGCISRFQVPSRFLEDKFRLGLIKLMWTHVNSTHPFTM